MSQTNITIRMDKDLKVDAEKLFHELGLNFTTALTMFTRAAVREQRIPFELSLSSFNRETTLAMEDAEANKNLVGPFSNVEELMESLNADD